MRMIVRRTLRQANIECTDVQEANNGVEALAAIRASCPDVVLSDWNMPQMSGLELLQTLKSEGVKVLFGFVTSEGTPAMRTQAMDAGARFLITKPFTEQNFQEAFAQVK
jgi:two-component system chemotaxis response regulator CheY